MRDGKGGGLDGTLSGGGGLVGALGGTGVATADTSTSISIAMSSSAESADTPDATGARIVPLSRSARRAWMRSP
jgi:hypothetical protein